MEDSVIGPGEAVIPRRVYYCILKRCSRARGQFSTFVGSQPQYGKQEEYHVERGCVSVDGAFISLSAAIGSINQRRRKASPSGGHSCSDAAVERDFPATKVAKESGTGAIPVSSAEQLYWPEFEPRAKPEKFQLDKGNNVSQEAVHSSFDSTTKDPLQDLFFERIVGSFVGPSQDDMDFKRTYKDRFVSDEEGRHFSDVNCSDCGFITSGVDDVIGVHQVHGYTKVHVANCLEDIGDIGECGILSVSGEPIVHRDHDDTFALWIPINDASLSLREYAAKEVYLKLVYKDEQEPLNIPEKVEDEIDEFMSAHESQCSQGHPSATYSASSRQLSFDSEGSTPVAESDFRKARNPSDDFSSLLDESFRAVGTSASSGSRPEEQFSSNDRTEQQVRDEVNSWAYNSIGEVKDIRTLLYTIVQVMWKSSRWTPIDISACADDKEVIRRHYRKALLVCHPDKHMRSDWETSLRAQLLTQALQEAWANM